MYCRVVLEFDFCLRKARLWHTQNFQEILVLYAVIKTWVCQKLDFPQQKSNSETTLQHILFLNYNFKVVSETTLK